MITKNAPSHSIVIRPSGDLDALTAEHYRQTLRPLMAEGYRYVIFDMEEVEYVTSGGLGLLVELHNHVLRQEGSLRLINAGTRVQWLLKQTKLDTVLLTAEENSPTEFAYDSLHSLMSQEILFCAKLNDVAERALKLSDPAEIAQLTMEGIAGSIPTKAAALFLLRNGADQLALAASRDLSPEAQEAAEEVTLHPASFGALALSRDEILYQRADDTEAGGGPSLRRLLGFGRTLYVPIHGEKQKFGLLALEEAAGDSEPIEAMKPLLRTFASICGLALEKAQLLKECEMRAEDLQRTLDSAQKFQSALVDVGKLASLGAVISGLGHLLNNKLVPIIGYTQLLTRNKDLPDKTKHQLETVNTAAVELKDVMEKLIKVSRVREISQELVDANEIVRRTVTLLRHQLDEREVTIDLQLDENVPLIIADHDLLVQGFLAILHRALTSFPDERYPRWISVRSQNCGSALNIEFEDNGGGLGELTAEEWLDPLVPYTELSKGRLFNYSIPRSVIRRHKGTIELTPREDGGTLVQISLPVVRESYSFAPVAGEAAPRAEIA